MMHISAYRYISVFGDFFFSFFLNIRYWVWWDCGVKAWLQHRGQAHHVKCHWLTEWWHFDLCSAECWAAVCGAALASRLLWKHTLRVSPPPISAHKLLLLHVSLLLKEAEGELKQRESGATGGDTALCPNDCDQWVFIGKWSWNHSSVFIFSLMFSVTTTRRWLSCGPG